MIMLKWCGVRFSMLYHKRKQLFEVIAMAKNKVVIVDEEKWILKGVEKTFEFDKYGFEICFRATKANDAIEYIKANDVDVVFADAKIQNMTGLEFVKSVKETGKNPYFVMFLEYDDYSYMRSSLESDVFDYCLKPIARQDAEEVLKRLRNYFDESQFEEVVNSSIRTIGNKNFSKLIDYINENYGEKLMLKTLAKQFYFNPNYLCMLFNKYFGKTYSQYVMCLRLEKARELLVNKNISTYDVATSVGFNSYSYFNKKYFQHFGETPANTKNGSAKEPISQQQVPKGIEYAKKEDLIYAMQNQINPHFMLHTLELIRSIAAVYDVSEIETISVNIAELFRYNANDSLNAIIRDEIEMAKKYLYVTKQRLGSVFETRFDVPEELMDDRIIKMVFQPIIDNAITHGIGDLERPFIIAIKARQVNNYIEISVTDNGNGIDADVLGEINKDLKNNKFFSDKKVGLVNLSNRLSLAYGSTYSLKVYSKKNCYTKVVLKIPRDK